MLHRCKTELTRAIALVAIGAAGLISPTVAHAATVISTGSFQSFGGAYGGDDGPLCLDVLYADSNPGASLDSSACNRTEAQSFTLVEAGVGINIGGGQELRAGVGSNLCVSVPNGVYNGSPVELEPCNRSTIGQNWSYLNGELFYQPNQSYCLDVRGGSTDQGTSVDLARCNVTEAQLWWPEDYAITVQSEIPASYPGRCLDDYADLDVNGGLVDNAACNGTNAQIWRLGWAIIANMNGEALQASTPNASGTAPVGLFKSVDPYNALNGWRMQYANTGVMFVNDYFNWDTLQPECLNVIGGLSAPGIPVDLHSCNQTTAQIWQVFLG